MKFRLGIAKISPLSFPDNEIFWGRVNDRVIISEPKGDFDYILNNIGSKIWILYMEGKDISEIINIIADEYNVNKEKIRRDLTSFIDELKRENLLKV